MRDWRWPSAVPAYAHGGGWLRSLRHRSGPLKITKRARDMSGGGIILCCEGPVGSISRAWSDSGSGEMSCSREIIDRKPSAAPVIRVTYSYWMIHHFLNLMPLPCPATTSKRRSTLTASIMFHNADTGVKIPFLECSPHSSPPAIAATGRLCSAHKFGNLTLY